MALKAIFHCSRFARAGEATNFNHVKNQSPGHAKKVECSSTFMACPRAVRRTKNAQVRQLQRKLSNVRSARAGKATAMENGLYRAENFTKPYAECPSQNNLQVEASKTINDIFQIRLKYCMSHVAYILRSAHSKRARPQCNALNKIVYLFTLPSYLYIHWLLLRHVSLRDYCVPLYK